MKRFFCCAIFVLFAFSGVFAESQQTSFVDALQSDYNSSRISRAEFVAYQLMGVLHHPDLPSKYRDYRRDDSRMGTAMMLEAHALLESTTGIDKRLLEAVLQRPDNLPLAQISPSGLFKLHYTDEGRNAAADTFITRSAAAYDEVYDIIVYGLGFDPPPVDDPLQPEYDVYVYAVGGYGLSTPEYSAPSEKYPHGVTSYISMDNQFESTYTRGVDGMLVTAAHEFFHMVQLGMRNFSTSEIDSRFLFEGTATWMEDYAYDDINDYLQYLPYYMSHLDNSFYSFNGLHEYGSCIFYHMLETKYGAEIIKKIWSEFATKELWEALDGAMQHEGSDFKSEIADHMVWNYFTGQRANPEFYYPEGDLYPTVQPHFVYDIEEVLGFSEQTACLSANYIKIEATTFGDLMVLPTMAAPAHWLYSVIDDPVNLNARAKTVAGSSTVLLSQISAANDIYIIPTNVNIADNGDAYEPEEIYSFDLTLGQMENLAAGIQGIHPNPFQPSVHSQGLQIDVRLTEKTKQIIYHIVNEYGGVVFSDKIQFDASLNGDFPLFWNGKNNDGNPVSAGVYLIYIDAEQAISPGKIAVVR